MNYSGLHGSRFKAKNYCYILTTFFICYKTKTSLKHIIPIVYAINYLKKLIRFLFNNEI